MKYKVDELVNTATGITFCFLCVITVLPLVVGGIFDIEYILKPYYEIFQLEPIDFLLGLLDSIGEWIEGWHCKLLQYIPLGIIGLLLMIIVLIPLFIIVCILTILLGLLEWGIIYLLLYRKNFTSKK